MTPESPESPPESPTAPADIVERLRGITFATPHEAWHFVAPIRQAANEIERLRAALEGIAASGAYPEAAIAQEALEAT